MNTVPQVVVVGSSNTDMIVRAPRLPRPGETVLGGAFAQAAGGKGANQAVAAARLGASVALVARVGADAWGDAAVAGFAAEGMDVSHVGRDPDAPSGMALICVDTQGGENTIVVAPGANARLSAGDVEAAGALLHNARVTLCQLEVPLPAVEAALTLAQRGGAVSILNPAPAQALPMSLLARASILTPNQTEAAALTGENDPARAAAALVAQGVPTVLVTLGADGVLWAGAQGARHLPGFSVAQVADTTAAGDCFSGALSAALAEQQDMEQDMEAAIRFAQAAAALCVTRQGAQPSLPTRAAVERFLAGS